MEENTTKEIWEENGFILLDFSKFFYHDYIYKRNIFKEKWEVQLTFSISDSIKT